MRRIGADVVPGDRVLVIQLAGGRDVPDDLIGTVLAPGYCWAEIEANPKSEPARRVIAVQLDDGRIRDATMYLRL